MPKFPWSPTLQTGDSVGESQSSAVAAQELPGRCNCVNTPEGSRWMSALFVMHHIDAASKLGLNRKSHDIGQEYILPRQAMPLSQRQNDREEGIGGMPSIGQLISP